MNHLEIIMKIDWPVNLIMTVQGEEKINAMVEKLPDDYEGSVEYALVTFLEYHEADMIRMRYQKKRSLSEIAAKHDLNEEQVWFQIEKSILKLKNPFILGYFQYGVAAEISRKAEHRRELIESDAYWKGYQDAEKEMVQKQERELQEKQPEELPKLVADLGLSMRAHTCLNKAGIRLVEVLLGTPYRDLLDIRNLGKKTADEIVALLRSKGHSLLEEP